LQIESERYETTEAKKGTDATEGSDATLVSGVRVNAFLVCESLPKNCSDIAVLYRIVAKVDNAITPFELRGGGFLGFGVKNSSCSHCKAVTGFGCHAHFVAGQRGDVIQILDSKEASFAVQAIDVEVSLLNEPLINPQIEGSTVELDALRQQISELMDDQKERELTVQALMAENRALKLRDIDTTEYRTWSPTQFAAWIVSLDRHSYAQYEAKLMANLQKEGVDGSCIDAEITSTELVRWGITQCKHYRNVLKHINTLIAEPGHHSQEAAANEGAPTAYMQ